MFASLKFIGFCSSHALPFRFIHCAFDRPIRFFISFFRFGLILRAFFVCLFFLTLFLVFANYQKKKKTNNISVTLTTKQVMIVCSSNLLDRGALLLINWYLICRWFRNAKSKNWQNNLNSHIKSSLLYITNSILFMKAHSRFFQLDAYHKSRFCVTQHRLSKWKINRCHRAFDHIFFFKHNYVLNCARAH